MARLYFGITQSIGDQPKNVIFAEELEKVVPKHDGKDTHFLVKLKGGKELHLKASTPEEAGKWVIAIEAVRKMYEGKTFIDLNASRKWKEQVDPTVLNACMEEVESRTR